MKIKPEIPLVGMDGITGEYNIFEIIGYHAGGAEDADGSLPFF